VRRRTLLAAILRCGPCRDRRRPCAGHEGRGVSLMQARNVEEEFLPPPSGAGSQALFLEISHHRAGLIPGRIFRRLTFGRGRLLRPAVLSPTPCLRSARSSSVQFGCGRTRFRRHLQVRIFFTIRKGVSVWRSKVGSSGSGLRRAATGFGLRAREARFLRAAVDRSSSEMRSPCRDNFFCRDHRI